MTIEAENSNTPQKPQLNISAVSCSVVHCKKAPYDVYKYLERRLTYFRCEMNSFFTK